jgi:hypothetical protein
MSNDEIAHVLEFALDRIRAAHLDGQATPLVVAIRAPGCRMASTADRRLARRGDSVPFKPSCVVA